MRIDAMLRARRPVFSFEFSPPHDDDGVVSLFRTIETLRELAPDFVSVTYGAGGGQRTRTVEVVHRIRRELAIEPMAHLTCVGAGRDELHAVLRDLEQSGIENILALRGDPPAGTTRFVAPEGGLARASELIAFIREHYRFCIGSACYPEKHLEAADMDAEVRHTRNKVNAGANFLITQLFFDNRSYFDYVARLRAGGVDVPVIPGIMPITNAAQVQRFTQRIGATVPRPLMQGILEREHDADAVLQLGVAWATLQCAELLARGAPGIHFYTLNRSPATRAILSALQARRPWES